MIQELVKEILTAKSVTRVLHECVSDEVVELAGHLLLQAALSQLSDQVRLSNGTRSTLDVRKNNWVPFDHNLHDSCVTVLKGIHAIDILVYHDSNRPRYTREVPGSLTAIQDLRGEIPDLFFCRLDIATSKNVGMLNLCNSGF